MTIKQKRLHIYSVFAFALCLSIFFILGGGSSGSDNVTMKDSLSINTSVPLAANISISEDRLSALKKSERINNDMKKSDELHDNILNNSNIYNNDSSSCSTTATVSSGGKSFAEVNSVKINSSMATNKGNGINTLDNSTKNAIMRQKRAQLEKELGINLSDYGYNKYALDDQENKKLDIPNDSNAESTDKTDAFNSYKGFYGIKSEEDDDTGDIRAVVHGDYTDITTGSIIKFRTLDDIEISRVLIPRNTFIYGRVSFGNGRCLVKVQNINYNSKILKFNGAIYDADGFEGLYVPENKLGDTKDKAISNALGAANIDFSSSSRLVNSTVSAVGNTIKGAIQGSIKESKISISSNYLVTIKKQK